MIIKSEVSVGVTIIWAPQSIGYDHRGSDYEVWGSVVSSPTGSGQSQFFVYTDKILGNF